MIVIREERAGDVDGVRAVHLAAFPGPTEADIVDALRDACPEAVSLVAVDGEDVVGHVLFSPVEVSGGYGTLTGLGLGPMAVEPARQRQGIGSELVEVGLHLVEERGCPFVVVIGHPDFYPRFGFRPAAGVGLTCQWEGVPDDAFMVRMGDAASGVSGRARYRPEFDSAT